MSDYDNTNSGALFKNDKQGNAKRPDYKGQINVDGTEFWISAWLNTSKKGEKYMSLKLQPKEGDTQDRAIANGPPPPATSAEKPYDDDIPF